MTMLTKMPLIVYLVYFLKHSKAAEYICNHSLWPLSKTQLYNGYHGNFKAGSLKPAKLRITVEYIGDFFNLTNSEMIKKDIIEPAVEYWHNTLTVLSPLSSPLLIDQFCDKETFIQTFMNTTVSVCNGTCHMRRFPPKLFAKCYQLNKNGELEIIGTDGEGLPNTDLGLLVTNTLNCHPNVLASARSFKLDKETDRPVFGLIMICSQNIKFSDVPRSRDIVKHELGHVLAFSVDLYAYFRDENGVPRTPRDDDGFPILGSLFKMGKKNLIYTPDENTFKILNVTENTPVGNIIKKVAMLTTPKIMKEIMVHFNCNFMLGAPMEDTTGEINGWSHFEKRIFFDTLMVPSITGRLYTTRFDLAVMEDSGWYIPDYSRAIKAEFGKGLGCDFVNKGCYEYLELKKSKGLTAFPFCYENKKLQCSNDRKSFYRCVLMRAPHNILQRYRYLHDKSLYFPSPTTDYCPMYSVRGFSNESINKWSFNCENGNLFNGTMRYSLLKNIFQIGATSLCMDSPNNGAWKESNCEEVLVLPIWGGGCYKYICSPTYRLLIEINNEDFQCLYDEEDIQIITITPKGIISGSIICPKYSDVCQGMQSENRTLSKKSNDIMSNCPTSIKKNTFELSVSFPLILSVTVIHSLSQPHFTSPLSFSTIL